MFFLAKLRKFLHCHEGFIFFVIVSMGVFMLLSTEATSVGHPWTRPIGNCELPNVYTGE